MTNLKKERVIAYLDGFNLYFGMLEAGYKDYKWLDLRELVISLLKENQELSEIKYFTSRVSNNPDKQKRQSIYIEALESKNIKIYYGHYQRDKIGCERCGNVWPNYNEKMTDVNIATQILLDGYKDKYDMAMLVSGDSDLVPPIKAIHENFNDKRVFVAFPPKRFNNSVAIVARGSLIIGRKKLVQSQFPDEVVKSDGYVLHKPIEWRE
ncbi:MAG: NYN domain-containing protein [Ignavibacteriaceae bacterium]|nr:NYN domain-containing protein [Ignavibacteriaceae bacterium]